MKNELENGVKSFIESGLIAANLEVPVHAASGGETIDDAEPFIVAKIDRAPHLVAGLGLADLLVLVSSPHSAGYEAHHATFTRFTRKLFSAAIAPNLPVNAAHLSDFVFTATAAEISVRGFHIEGFADSDTENWKQDGINIKLGLINHFVFPNCPPLGIEGGLVI